MSSNQINNNKIIIPAVFLINDFIKFLNYFCKKCAGSDKNEIYKLLDESKQLIEKKDNLLNFEEIYESFEKFIIEFFLFVGKNISIIKRIENIEFYFEEYRKDINLTLEKQFKETVIATDLYLCSLKEQKFDKENFENHLKVSLVKINTQININHNNKIYIIKMLFSFIIYEFIFKNKMLFEDEIGITDKVRDGNYKLLKKESDKFSKIKLIIEAIKLAFEEYRAKRGDSKALQKFSSFIEFYCGQFRFKENRNENFFNEYHIDYLFYIINIELLEKMSNQRVLSNTSLAEDFLIKRFKLLNYNGVSGCKVLYYRKSTFSFLTVPVVLSADAKNHEFNNYIESRNNEKKYIEFHKNYVLKNNDKLSLNKGFENAISKTSISKQFYCSLNQLDFLRDYTTTDAYCYFKSMCSYLLIFSNQYYKNRIYREEVERNLKIFLEQKNSHQNSTHSFERSRNKQGFQSLRNPIEKISRQFFSSFREPKATSTPVFSRPVLPITATAVQPHKPLNLFTRTESINSISSVNSYSKENNPFAINTFQNHASNSTNFGSIKNENKNILEQKCEKLNSDLLNSVIAEIFQGKKIPYKDSFLQIKYFLKNPKIIKCFLSLKERCYFMEKAKINKLKLLWDNPKEFLKKEREIVKKFFILELITSCQDNSFCTIDAFKRKCFIMIIVLDKTDNKKFINNLFKSEDKYYQIIDKSFEKVKGVDFEKLPNNKNARSIEIIYYLIAILCSIEY
ncbi:hypothetical protein [Spirobacillus cienkowskii]|uniref:hypothetical protein n=1 Tax=Spirobacillus cienkowskii TaxID=495820 RepID=UPI0030CADC8C